MFIVYCSFFFRVRVLFSFSIVASAVAIFTLNVKVLCGLIKSAKGAALKTYLFLNRSCLMRTIHFTSRTTSTSSPQRAMSCLLTSASGRNSGVTFFPARTECEWNEKRRMGSRSIATSPTYVLASLPVALQRRALQKRYKMF